MRIIFTLLLLSFSLLSFGQIQRTIHKTIKQDQIHMVQVDFDREMEVEEWTGSRILIETTVSLEGANKNILEHLIEAGRYNLIEEVQGSVLRLDFHNIDKRIVVRGVEVFEKITLKFFVPEGVKVAQPYATR